MKISSQLSEKIISRLDSGESSESILFTVKADEKLAVKEFLDFYDFMKSQTLEIKPSRSNFKNTLNQTLLLAEADDEVSGWGSFFKSDWGELSSKFFGSFYLKTFGGLAFSLLLVFGISQEFVGEYFVNDLDSTQNKNTEIKNQKNLENIEVQSFAMANTSDNYSEILKNIRTQDVPVAEKVNSVILKTSRDFQMVQALEDEFNADIADFYETQKTFKNFQTETLFEDVGDDKITKLYKNKKTPILAVRGFQNFL